MSRNNHLEINRVTGEDELVPPSWSGRAEPMTVKEWGMREYEAGRVAGFKQAQAKCVESLQMSAGNCFAAGGDDVRAHILRNEAKMLAQTKYPESLFPTPAPHKGEVKK